jgi:flavorubredoxin
MFSYLVDDEVLFSQDAFGMHLASQERFADEIEQAILNYEAATYFANIILPYSPLVLKLIERVAASGLTFKVIASDHGPIWRRGEDIAGIISSYGRWALQKATGKAVVVYASMWHSTEAMARAIGEGLAQEGMRVKLMSLDHVHRSEVVYELLDAGAVVVGSPTLNNGMMPQMADMLIYLKGLRPQNLIGAAFGSYGWSGEAVQRIEEVMKEMEIELVCTGLRTKYVPNAEILAACNNMGKEIAKRLKEQVIR